MSFAAVAVIAHVESRIIKGLSKFLAANYVEEELSGSASFAGIELISEDEPTTNLIKRSITIKPDNISLYVNCDGLTLMEAFIIVFYEATPNQDFNFFQKQWTNTFIYMLGIADLLLQGKIELYCVEKRSITDWFNSDCYVRILDPSPCGNHLDGYFDILKACVNSNKRKAATVQACRSYAMRSFPFHDPKKYSGFLDAIDSLIAKGVFMRNIDTSVFHWVGLGSYYYKICDPGRSIHTSLREQLRRSLLECTSPSSSITEFNRILLSFLILGGDVHQSVFGNKYLRGIFSDTEVSENRVLLQHFKQDDGKKIN